MAHKKLKSPIIALLIGLLTVFAVRFAMIKDDHVHYHANFALYVNGAQDKFENFTFYEEVAACSSDHSNPKERAHMHDQKNHVIHVHASGVTWGHFFANLGYGLSNKSLTTDTGTFVDADNNKQLTFVLNGSEVTSVANQLIKSEDVLLINYGTENQTEIKKRFEAITKDGHDYNFKSDPASCAGAEKLDLLTRLKRTFDLTK